MLLDERGCFPQTSLPQVGITEQRAVKQFDEVAALLDGDFPLGNTFFQVLTNPLEDLRALVLDIFQTLPAGVTVDNRVDHVAGTLVESDVDSIGVTEKVVQIAQNLLICPDKEKSYLVVLILFDLVQRQEFGPAVLADKAGYLAIRIASDVGNRGDHVRLLVETLDRQYREKLIDCP